MKFQPVRGTHDLYSYELAKYRCLEEVIRSLAKIYGFNEIITPIFEHTELFKKPLGQHSDIVLKEMYTFKDRNNSSLTLRPEYTTPMIRAAISNSLLEKIPKKFYGIGPMFRRERPQKGRYRQFNQINFEILGSHDVAADVELILLADDILKNLFPNKKILLQLNSLGDNDTLKIYKENLSLYYEKYKNKLSDESRAKIHTNPLRILDSKKPQDLEINNNAPRIYNFYSENAKIKFDNLQTLLKDAPIDFEVNPKLVRGLDYYCHTVFEFKSDDLGTQDTLIGGGRYDGLTKLLGGPDIPGVGWAGGVERIIMLMQNNIKIEKKVYLVLINESFKSYGLRLINLLRKNKIPVFFDYKYNLKKSLSNANHLNSEYAIIIGEDEIKNNTCTIKNLYKNSQKTVAFEQVVKTLS
jgi:histidyl-tRNA synthetase